MCSESSYAGKTCAVHHSVRLPQQQGTMHSTHYNVKLNLRSGLWEFVTDSGGRIQNVTPMTDSPTSASNRKIGEISAVVDWNGDFLSPPAIDLQINGIMGITFPQLNEEDLPALHKVHMMRRRCSCAALMLAWCCRRFSG
jgi:hypothetical protein